MSDSSDSNLNEQISEAFDKPSIADAYRAIEIASLGKEFSNFTYDANFCIYFKLVHNRREAEEDIREGAFLPDFVHQFFLDSERIFGYKKPIIRLFYSASRLKRYVKFDFDEKLTRERDGIEPDDVMKALSPVLDDLEYTQNLNHFIEEVESKEEKEFKPPGNLLYEFECPYLKHELLSRAQREQLEMSGNHTNGDSTKNSNGSNKCQEINGASSSSTSNNATSSQNGSSNKQNNVEVVGRKKYQIYHANGETNGFQQFQARMQSLIMWFIESATMVDFEDPRWDFFMVFEKYNESTVEDPSATSVSTEDRYYFAGYASVYRYYAYPDRTRPRVSQMLLLPPYRRNHIGTTLLQSIYDYYKKLPATLDITAEDPDEEFIAMRDFLDCKNCQTLEAFQPERLKKGWSDEIAKQAQQELRLCQRQSRKVYEILKLKNVNPTDEEEVKSYRLEIKNRLNIPHQRLKLDCDKVVKKGYELPEEMRMQRDNPKLASATLDENYQELVKQYQHTIDKLKNVTS